MGDSVTGGLTQFCDSLHTQRFQVLVTSLFEDIPGDFVTNVKQINSQSNLTSMSNFGSPSYLTVRSSLFIILI